LVVIRNKNLDGDYNTVTNKPSINGVTLEGNKTSAELKLENELFYKVKAKENITKGTLLQIDGVGTDYIEVVKANWEIVGCYPQYFIGIATTDIASGNYGTALYFGRIDGVNTSSWTDGAYLYVSETTAGSITNVPTTSLTMRELIIGCVLVVGTSGSIQMRPENYPRLIDLADTEISSSINDGDYIAFDEVKSKWTNKTALDLSVYKTYAGFINRTDTLIAIDGSGVFSLTPWIGFDGVYINGAKKNLSVTQYITVTADQTITYIYLDSAGVLQKSTTAWDITSGTNIPVAIVFKDGNTYAMTDERHGYERNKAWHNWAHMNIGAMYKSGLTGTFGNTTLSVTQGVIYDEDIKFDTGGTKTATSLWYRNATTGMRLVRGATACKSVSGGGVLQYDNGSGTLHDVSLNSYVTNWVYCSNDPTEPIYTVVGQNNSNTLTLARNASAPTINLSTAEWKLIYKVIYQHTAGTTSGVFVEATDYRAVQTGVPTASVITDHATLINRDASNSHPATAISYDDGSGTLSNVQTQLSKQAKLIATGEAINVAGLVTLNGSDGKIYTSFEYGTPYKITNNYSPLINVVDIDKNKALIFDGTDNGTPSVTLVSVSGNTITKISDNSNVAQALTFSNGVKIATNKAIYAYHNYDGGAYSIKACVITVSGSTISFGSATILKNVNLNVTKPTIRLAYLSSNKVIAIYNDPNDSNNYYYNVLTISGTTITASTATVISELAGKRLNSVTYLSRSNFILLNYTQNFSQDEISKYFRIVLVASNSSLLIGDENTLSSVTAGGYTKVVPIDQARFLITTVDYINSGYLFGFVCKWTTQVKIDSISSYCVISTANVDTSYQTLINLDSSRFLLVYAGYSQILTVDDEVVKASVPKTGFLGAYSNIGVYSCNLSSGKAMIVFKNGTNYEAYAVVIDVNTSTGLVLTPQFSSNLITGRTDDISVVPYISLT
jgi:hypothetical protein